VGQPLSLSSPVSRQLLVSLASYQLAQASPPAPATFDQRVIDVGAIGQEHLGKDSFVLVFALDLGGDFFAMDQF
jgi:hypothetical protein